MYKAVIVEDEHLIAGLHRRLLTEDGRFTLTAEFRNGKKALQFLSTGPVDLLILDLYMPQMSGLALLRELRRLGHATDVIVVTAAHEAATLLEIRALGPLDYLVKPFTPQRFSDALDAFCRQREQLSGKERVCQSDIDSLLYRNQKQLPKGLQEKTVMGICAALGQACLGCEEVAQRAGVSVVTARRYLNFLVEDGRAYSEVHYDTGGRPRMLYGLLGGRD